MHQPFELLLDGVVRGTRDLGRAGDARQAPADRFEPRAVGRGVLYVMNGHAVSPNLRMARATTRGAKAIL